jgi:outer membrane biosynthesis protein TonB
MLHGGLVVVALVILGARGDDPPVIELTPIEVVAPPPPTPLAMPGPSAPGTQSGASASPKMGALGRRGHDAPQRSQTRAPAVADPFADLEVSYDTDARPDPGPPDGTTGLGRGTALIGSGNGDAAGFGYLGDGPGALRVPPPPASLARPPRPKHSYHDWQLPAVGQFAGSMIEVMLTIDSHGNVGDVRVLTGVEDTLDRRASDIARGFEFYPALSSAGEPTPGRYRWQFVILESQREDESMVDSLRMSPLRHR